MEEIQELKTIYNEWMNQTIDFKNFDQHIEIRTPFVDMHHDYIELFFIKVNDHKFILSDDGYTMSELEMMDINIKTSPKRKEYFTVTLKIFGVKYDGQTGELYVDFESLSEYPAKQHLLIQCILRISDMLLTSRNTGVSIFSEEIAKFFDENNVAYVQNFGFVGMSGNTQTFDFIIPHSRKKREKLIKAINSPRTDNYISALFPWLDIRETRPQTDFIVLANDSESPVPEKFTRPIENYSSKVLVWSEREKWVSHLKLA